MVRSAARLLLSIFVALAALGASAASPNFGELEQRLQIRPEQKAQYDLAVGASKRALLAVGLVAMQLKERLAAELMKPEPDFNSMLRAHEQILDQFRPQFREAGEEWRKLYAILDDKQVRIAKDFVRENLSRFIQ
ncbi:MAG: hypothetical protein ACXWBQ_04330 [Usitatibacter sp.]